MSLERFDAIVVGTGFGGSVVTHRLAEAGLDVCTLERGRAYPPGSFPRTPHALSRAFWDPSEGHYGMFNMWSFKGIDALVSSALGGGSIVYANVLLRKDEKWFVKEDPGTPGWEHWPVTRADLDPHYDVVEKMIGVAPYPMEHPPYDRTTKARAHIEAAQRLGLDWFHPNLAVTFANPGQPPVPGEPIQEAEPNMFGRTRYTCRLCGECDVGCNYGSKNTLDYTYLSAAQRSGAEIRTLCEVRTLEPVDGGYRVRYVEHEEEREGQPFDTRSLSLREVEAPILVLGAGSLGSTFLLLKNRASFPGVGDALGSKFCGNGDLLGFAWKAKQFGLPRALDPNYGAVITTAIRLPDELDGGEPGARGGYIEDSGYPHFMSWLVETFDVGGGLGRLAETTFRTIWARITGDTDLSAEIQGAIGGTLSSSTSPLLGMGRDRPSGRFSVNGARLDCDWRLKDSRPYFDRLETTMKRVAEAMTADFIVNPSWLLNRVVTVHPLGGCPMGRSPQEGVVDDRGQVFGHPGFFIADGSILPGPVGPNPSLTIAAVADRVADRILEDRAGG